MAADFRSWFAAAGLATVALCSSGVDAETQPADPLSADIAECEQILRQAGASPAERAKFEAEMRGASPADIAQAKLYYRQLSPAGLAEVVERLRHSPDDQYVPGKDSLPQTGVPKGKTFEFTFDRSSVFPGTTRKITVYVPAEYSADEPASVYVGLDGLGFAAPTVFDNLIYKREMPVTIAIGIAPGTVNSADPPQSPRFNRSFEFDGLSDNLARFVLEEIFPEVERRRSPDGLPIRLSRDPNNRAAGGSSTGGIAAFTLAWERPDAFRRVFTAIGTFVGMRGGDRYAVLVRKTEPKPLRIFMQDGSNDELTTFIGEAGSWWMSNQTMQRAFAFAGYQVEHAWGSGSHHPKHATAVFPDAMRWLWKDWPQPIAAGTSQNVFLKAILQPGEGWEPVAGDYRSGGALAANPEGAIAFYDAVGKRTYKVLPDGELASAYDRIGEVQGDGLAFGPDGRIYASQAQKIVAYTTSGRSSTVAQGIGAQHFVVTHDGRLYVTESNSSRKDVAGKLWLIRSGGEKVLLDSELKDPSGVVLSPDGLWLAVAESNTHWGYSYRVQSDGSVQDKQRFYWFHVSDTDDDSGARAWAMDRDGRLYAATRMGVQVFDHNGRVRAILPLPGGEVTGLSFGGANFDTLYVSCADQKLYRRKLNIAGAPPWASPIALPNWGPG
jgi:sugar lactone lactonase YvrE/enterochelin esterase-like enzyme